MKAATSTALDSNNCLQINGKRYKESLRTLNKFIKAESVKNNVRIAFEECCLHTEILHCVKRLFSHNSFNQKNITTLSFTNCKFDDEIFEVPKFFKHLRYLPNLVTFYLYESQNTRTDVFYEQLHQLVLYKSKHKPLNVSIIRLYYPAVQSVRNIDKMGYLLQEIAINCFQYFYTYTNQATNKTLLRYFVTAGSIICRRSENKTPEIYLGNYILPAHDGLYEEYTSFMKDEFALKTHKQNIFSR